MSVTMSEQSDLNHEFVAQGSNQSGMRERNERLVLTILRQQGALPKAEIARKTGLSAQTVSVIMRALERDGLLEKGAKVRGKVGQPSVPMRLAPDGAYFFGLKVGRRSIEMVLVDFIGRIKARRRETYRYPTPETTLDFTRRSVSEIASELPHSQRTRIAGLGIASPYFLWEWASTIGVAESKMSAWRTCDLEADINAMFDFPVYLGNDASCACAAELVFGRSEKPRDFLYFYVGYFIGGGVVLNGNLYTGSSGNAGAIGPLPMLHPSGTKGQLMDVASLNGLESRVLQAGGTLEALWANPDHWDIDEALLEDWMSEAVPAITMAILSAVSVIDFSAVFLDGFMPGDLRLKISDKVRRDLQSQDVSGLNLPEVLSGTIGADARPLGAASLALSKRFMLETG